MRLRRPDTFLSLPPTATLAYSSSPVSRKHGSARSKILTHTSTMCWQSICFRTSRITATTSTTSMPSTYVCPFRHGGESLWACRNISVGWKRSRISLPVPIFLSRTCTWPPLPRAQSEQPKLSLLTVKRRKIACRRIHMEGLEEGVPGRTPILQSDAEGEQCVWCFLWQRKRRHATACRQSTAQRHATAPTPVVIQYPARRRGVYGKHFCGGNN